MNIALDLKKALAARLLEGLVDFRREGVDGVAPHAPGLFSYCAVARERLRAARLAKPVVGVVLSGAKEIWIGDRAERFTPGAMFVLPGGVDLHIVNEPGERTPYQSLVIEVTPDETPDLGPPPRLSPQACHAVPLTPELVEAAVHAARAISAGPGAATVRSARLAELVALLHSSPAARPLFDLSTQEQVARRLRGALDRNWTAAELARRMATSESTLRRRLAAEGASFAAILRRERMHAARRLIANGASAREAAGAVGYVSRAHFARAFRAEFGVNPARA